MSDLSATYLPIDTYCADWAIDASRWMWVVAEVAPSGRVVHVYRTADGDRIALFSNGREAHGA